jgi:ubiquitin-conjugating enzyme E2 J2
MASAIASRRLRRELLELQQDPPPGIIAEPLETNILVWHYVIHGASETPFEGGSYIGTLKFPSEYPMKGPSIYMNTPNGRFQVGIKLCLSMSDFHPESWNPMWKVSSIIQGIQSFMASTELTTGAIATPSEAEQRTLAAASMAYNQKNFGQLFDGNIPAAFEKAKEARTEAERKKEISPPATSTTTTARGTKKTTKQKSSEDATSDVKKESGKQEKDVDVVVVKEELSPEEVEKRRLKNAKKRAKQKAKVTNQAPTPPPPTTTSSEETASPPPLLSTSNHE